MEYQRTVDFTVNLFLCKRAVTVGRKNEFTLLGTPVNDHAYGGVGLGCLQVERNSGILAVLDTEHLGSLGVDAFRQNSFPNHGVDESRFTGTVSTYQTDIDIVLA